MATRRRNKTLPKRGIRTDHSGDTHPALQNPLILEKIIEFASVQDLTACRLVSKFWRDTATKSWNTRATVHVNDPKRLLELWEIIEATDTPHSINTHVNFTFTSSYFFENETVEKFWKILGPRIKILKLIRCNFFKWHLFRQVLFKCCSNMEHLHLDHNSILAEAPEIATLCEKRDNWRELDYGENSSLKYISTDPDIQTYSSMSWMELFSRFPSLEVFRLTASKKKDVDAGAIYTAINTIRRDNPAKLKLKHLFVMVNESIEMSTLPDTLHQLLLDPEIHLKKLSLSPNVDDYDIPLKQILCHQADSLISLELDGRHSNCNLYLDPSSFPASFKLEKLEELTLHSPMFTSLGVLRFMPNLKKLTLAPLGYDIVLESNLTDLQDIRLEKCVELEVQRIGSADDIRKLVSLMPNVEMLRMPVNKGIFPSIIEGWPKLMSFGIIDVDKDACDYYISHYSQFVKMVKISRSSTQVTKRRSPRLTSPTGLKYLQRLYLTSPDTTEVDLFRLEGTTEYYHRF